MNMPDARTCLEHLQSQKLQKLQDLPKDKRGIYALADHQGNIRYIGKTASPAESFHKRINQRHTTGSENYSHKFSSYYNVGRIWCGRKSGAANADETLARKVRQAMIRRHCRAAYIAIDDHHAGLAALEAEIIRLAPPEMRHWNNIGSQLAIQTEPEDLVDQAIRELGLGSQAIPALDRQAALFARQTRSGFDRRLPMPEMASLNPLGSIFPIPDEDYRFVALDVETANNSRGSICQIGIACVRQDNSIHTASILVNPLDQFHPYNVKLHGISPDMVADAPTFPQIMAHMQTVLQRHIVVQHSSFDRQAIEAASLKHGVAVRKITWIDSVAVAKRAWPELKHAGGYGLSNLSSFLGIAFSHHDAGHDARAAAEVVLMAERKTGHVTEE
tara:strand:+ start:2080 stop:3243 length:1164 start_codon:yes stop_codon:yes gene_type:complete